METTTSATASEVAELLLALIEDGEQEPLPGRTLAELGLDVAGVEALWAAALEEFGDRSPVTDTGPGTLSPEMPLEVAARAIAARLGAGDARDVDRARCKSSRRP